MQIGGSKISTSGGAKCGPPTKKCPCVKTYKHFTFSVKGHKGLEFKHDSMRANNVETPQMHILNYQPPI